MKKYIISNCPCYDNRIWQEPTCNTNALDCQNISDCLLKRIVELCKKEKTIICNIDGKEQILKAYYHTHIGDKVLELLEIEEVNE